MGPVPVPVGMGGADGARACVTIKQGTQHKPGELKRTRHGLHATMRCNHKCPHQSFVPSHSSLTACEIVRGHGELPIHSILSVTRLDTTGSRRSHADVTFFAVNSPTRLIAFGSALGAA